MPEAEEMINLAFLSDSERELIVEVLRRDEELRQNEEQRIRKLKADLLDIKRKGAKRSSGRYSQRSCGRCQQSLSRLNIASNQCNACKHNVCRDCRTARPDGSCLCTVCAKEADLKKSTGDWFYDQRVNRFSTNPGHDLVRSSLKKRPPLKRETIGDLLLRGTEIKAESPPPVPQPRLKVQTANQESDVSCSGSTPSEMIPQAEETSKQQSETEPGDKSSQKTDRETLDHPARRAETKAKSNPSGSSVSSQNVPVKADSVSVHSTSSEGNHASEEKQLRPSQESNSPDVDRIFKKSVKRNKAPAEHTSTLDLHQREVHESMGSRSQSVPGLDVQDEDEEDEDIDNLVNMHKKTVASSCSSLRSSQSTLGSQMSIYSEAGDHDSVDVCGDIVFTLGYDEHTQSLVVFIKECHGLAYGDAARRRSNPYVKCYLLPEKSRQSKRKTTTKRNTVNPVYNETLKYSVNRLQLLSRSLVIAVWHHGRMSRNAFLGEVMASLDVRDLDSPMEECVALVGKTATPVLASFFAQYKGELVISLKYIPPKMPTPDKIKRKKAKAEEGGELHVLIKEAKSLVAMKPGGTSDPFVKGYLIPANVKSTKRKTPVVKKNLDPHFDHTFVYKELSLEQLMGMCLELTVWDKESMSSNEFLGGVRLSIGTGTLNIGKEVVEMDSVGEEVSLWQKMMQYPDSWAEGTLPLRSSMGKTKAK